MDCLLLGSYIRLSCTLIKWNLMLAKITISLSIPIIPSTPTRWMNWPINDVHFRNLNCRQFSPVIYSISIVLQIRLKKSFLYQSEDVHTLLNCIETLPDYSKLFSYSFLTKHLIKRFRFRNSSICFFFTVII